MSVVSYSELKYEDYLAIDKGMKWRDRKGFYSPIIDSIFGNYDLSPVLGMGIAMQESTFRATVKNLSEKEVRFVGGSYGLMMMSVATARGLGFRGEKKELLNPLLNVELAAKLLVQLRRRKDIKDRRDLISSYNSNKPFDLAPISTRTVYVPNVIKYIGEFSTDRKE